MGFVRKITGQQKQIDAANRNADAQVKATEQAARDQQAAAAAAAIAAANAQRAAAERDRVTRAASDAASTPMGTADVALDAPESESAGITRKRTRAQFGKSYGSGVSI